MKSITLAILALVALSTAVSAQVYVQEYCNDPLGAVGIDPNLDGAPATSGTQSDDEFVEIVNAGAATVDLSGWTLADGFDVRHTFAAGTQLPAGAAIVVFGGGDVTNFNAAGIGSGVLASTGSLGLNNSSDTITLADAGGVVVDSVSYSSGGPGDGDGEAITKDPEGVAGTFTKHTLVNGIAHSAGYLNDGVTPYLPAILPAPVGPAYLGNVPASDLDIDVDINAASDDTADDIHSVSAGDILGLRIYSDNGTYDGAPLVLIVSTFNTGMPPAPIGFDPLQAPYAWFTGNVSFVLDGFASAGTLSAPVVGPGLGFYFSVEVPVALGGSATSALFQTFCAAPGLNNVGLAFANAHEFQIN